VELSVLPQLVLTGIILGAPSALLGLGMSLILTVARRFHFAFAFTFTLSAFVAAVLSTQLQVSVWLSVPAAIVVGAAAGALIEIFIYRPLIRRSGEDAGLLPVFVSALGISIAGESAIQLLWASSSPTVPLNLMPVTAIPLGPNLTLTSFDAVSFVLFTVIAMVGVVILRYTRVGQVVRGVRGNTLMARAVGIRPDAVNVWIFVIVSGVAGLVACFTAARYSAAPDMGLAPLFSSFVVAFLAGTQAPGLRVVIIGFALAILQSVAALVLPGTLTDVMVFGLLFVYLVVRGTGVLTLFRRTPRRA
jgi:branched-chain amino acid transport system permease protein